MFKLIIFAWTRLETKEMYNIFNMGIGMVIAVDKEECSRTCWNILNNLVKQPMKLVW